MSPWPKGVSNARVARNGAARREAIVRQLHTHGAQTVKAVAVAVGISPELVRYHTKRMREVDVISMSAKDRGQYHVLSMRGDPFPHSQQPVA